MTLAARGVAGAVLLCLATGSVEANGFKVVVNSANSVSAISKSEMSAIYLKRQTKWRDGGAVEMVDHKAKSTVRAAFIAEILGRDTNWVENYWQRIVFTGRGAPPPVLSSDQEVLDFVRSNPGGIGFIDESVSTGNGVKVVPVTD